MILFVTAVGLVLATAHAASPFIQKTRGEPWPRPQQINTTDVVLELSPGFEIRSAMKSCDELIAAFDRTMKSLPRGMYGRTLNEKVYGENEGTNMVALLTVEVSQDCQGHPFPTENSNENYFLYVTAKGVTLTAPELWGAIRGLETFSQLVYENREGELIVNETSIVDSPRFSFRGLMLDTSRHFISVPVVKEFLDAMAVNKFNIFHWHIVDSQSFPYQSSAFPDLSHKGAFRPFTHEYSQLAIKDIIEHARFLGIRVIPEFDTPGHTASWGLSQKGFLTDCGDNPAYSVLDPTEEANYDFLQKLFSEIFETFTDNTIHLGGDEVPLYCWMANKKIQAFMKAHNITKTSDLETYYFNTFLDRLNALKANKRYLVWQEVFDNGVKINTSTIINVWKGQRKFAPEVEKVTAAGFDVVVSSCWYLNYISYAADWHGLYQCDPQNFNGTAKQMSHVKGASACVWTEYIDATNLISRTFPRASAAAERFWSPKDVNDADKATARLEEHRCRMLRRGYGVEPVSGPGFCESEWNP